MRAFLTAAVLCLTLTAGAPPPSGPKVEIRTSYGPVVVELEPGPAPGTVANFLRYVDGGFYDGTIFHRVIPGFMVQGGGLGKDMAEKPAHGTIRNEAREAFKAGLKNVRGTLAMARTGDPDSASAQFFINTADNPSLDPGDGAGYCVFGRVVSGMEAVDKIEKVRTVMRHGMADVPDYPVLIRTAARLAEP